MLFLWIVSKHFPENQVLRFGVPFSVHRCRKALCLGRRIPTKVSNQDLKDILEQSRWSRWICSLPRNLLYTLQNTLFNFRYYCLHEKCLFPAVVSYLDFDVLELSFLLLHDRIFVSFQFINERSHAQFLSVLPR